jgi:predicted Zn-dependent peptidase
MSNDTMSVQVTRLPNGLRVATDRMDSVETVSLGVWADVGTRNETAEINGVSHLLEHMAFKGTVRRSARAIAEEIEAVGGHLNAYTAREQTAYYARILAGDLPVAVDIIADILQHSTFEAEELARERTVVLQEIGQAEDTPDDIIFDHFQATAFPDQPMGRPVLGRAEIVRDMQGETISGYLRRHYGPQRLVLSAAGKVDHAELVQLATRSFTDLPAGEPDPVEPARYLGGEYRGERDLEQVHLVLGLPGVSYLDPDYYALGILSTLFGGGMSSRLFQEIREKRGLVYSIYSFNSAFHDGGIFGVYAGTGEKEAEEILPLVIEELRRLPATLTHDELERARAQARAGVLMARESTSNRAEQLASQLLVHGRPLSNEEIMGRIEAVDAAQLGRIAHRLMAGQPTLAALGPLGRLARLDSVAGRLAA